MWSVHIAAQHWDLALTLSGSSFCLQSGVGSQGGVEPGTERSMLNAMPDFSASPLEQQQQQGRQEPEADSSARSGPSQVSSSLYPAALGSMPKTPNATVEGRSHLKEPPRSTSALGWLSTPARAGSRSNRLRKRRQQLGKDRKPSYIWSQIGQGMDSDVATDACVCALCGPAPHVACTCCSPRCKAGYC